MDDIKVIMQLREVTNDRLESLDSMINKHYKPIISKLFEDKDLSGLESLVNEIPNNYIKMDLYKSIRDLKKIL